MTYVNNVKIVIDMYIPVDILSTTQKSWRRLGSEAMA
jgi:hypothetical protein